MTRQNQKEAMRLKINVAICDGIMILAILAGIAAAPFWIKDGNLLALAALGAAALVVWGSRALGDRQIEKLEALEYPESGDEPEPESECVRLAKKAIREEI